MKKSRVLPILFAVVLISFGAVVHAQGKQDKVVMLIGDEHVGKVVGMNDTNIRFVHQGETLEYTFEKADINKIQFSSGRIEVVNKSTGTNANVNLQDHHNVVAVLPFEFIGDGGAQNSQLEKKAQTNCYNVLKKFASEFKIQDPVTTNAVIKKHGISKDNIDGFTPDEICQMLGSEYVVFGNITVLFTGTVSSSGATQTKKKKGNKSVSYTSGSSYSTDNYRTEVSMNIYNDQGNSIYAKSHDSFWQTQDAYEITLQWLIKRSPLYRK